MKLPNLDKNAFLSIYIHNTNIYADLSYVDYTSGRHYTLNDFTSVFTQPNLIYSSTFWREYFAGLREKFNWEIFRGKDIITMSTEGFGVSGVAIYFGGKKIQGEKLVTSVRDVSYSITLQATSHEYIRKILEGVSEKSGYEDVVYVNMDLLSCEVFRFTKGVGQNLLNMPLRARSSFEYADITWEKKDSLIENIKNTKLRAFLSTQTVEDKLVNTWANFVNEPFANPANATLQDTVRAYMTIQLITILNENGSKFENIGATRNNTLLVLGGSLATVINQKKLNVALLDGLELRGDVDVLIDTNAIFLRRGKSVVEGIENNEFIFSLNDILSGVNKYIISEGNAPGQRKVIFTGKHESSKVGEKEVYAFSNEITQIELNNEKEFISGRFVQGSFWGEKFQTFELFSDPRTVTYASLIIDGRHKPVVYGPDSRTNMYKLNNWTNENN